MKAVGYKVPGPIAEDASLVDIDLPRPVAEGGDILVEVKAVSVNPVDYKIRSSTPPADGDWKVLGWDAAGIVQEVGPDVTQFGRRRGLLCRIAHKAWHQCGVPSRRRPDRRS